MLSGLRFGVDLADEIMQVGSPAWMVDGTPTSTPTSRCASAMGEIQNGLAVRRGCGGGAMVTGTLVASSRNANTLHLHTGATLLSPLPECLHLLDKACNVRALTALSSVSCP